jgi:hypothetical protein
MVGICSMGAMRVAYVPLPAPGAPRNMILSDGCGCGCASAASELAQREKKRDVRSERQRGSSIAWGEGGRRGAA